MSRLIMYPGAILSGDVVADKIVRVVSLSATQKEWVFDTQPDLVLATRYQMDTDTDNPTLDGFIPTGTIMGVVNLDNAVQTVFENEAGAHTFFKIIAANRFQVNYFDAFLIDQPLPFAWVGRKTIAFILHYDDDVHFYLYYDGVVYSYTGTGETPTTTDTNLILKAGRHERLESFTGTFNVLETFQYLLKGTNLSGAGVAYDS